MTTLLAIDSTVNTRHHRKHRQAAPLLARSRPNTSTWTNPRNARTISPSQPMLNKASLTTIVRAENDVVNTHRRDIDPKDALKKYCKVGKSTLALADSSSRFSGRGCVERQQRFRQSVR